MLKKHRILSTPNANGFTLLEVLIALVIFSIGLLGLAGMQMQGLKYNHESYLRSQATLLAYDLLDRMRSNSTASASYVVNDAAATTTPPTNCAGNSASCSTADFATFDIHEWKTAIANTLPKGKGKVDADTVNTSPQNYIITITWAIGDRDSENNPDDKATFLLRTAP